MNAPRPMPFNAEKPQPLVRSVPEGAEYPFEALGPLQAVTRVAQEASQAPMALAAQSALAVASLAAQCHADVETLNGTAPLSLYAMSIAVSGERKSTTDKLLMAGLRDFERDANRAFEAETVAHKTAWEVWKVDHDLALAALKKKGADRAAAQADLERIGPEPESPLKPFLTATEPTLAGLHKLYAVSQPGLGVFSDEGGGFLGGHGMSRENRLCTLAGLSDLWGGEPIRRVRAGDGASILYGRRLSMHLMVQPVTAQDLLTDSLAQGQGFLARFLIAQPRSAIGTRLERGRQDTATLQAFAARLRAILEAPKHLAEGTRQELDLRTLPLSNSARELLWEYYTATEREQAPGGDLEGCTSFASKSPEQACRIAGVLTIWDNLDAPEVTGAAMANGIALAQYYLSEARRLADVAVVSRETAEAEKLRLWLLDSWPGISAGIGRDASTILPSDILQRGPSSLREAKKVAVCIRLLVDAGWLASLSDLHVRSPTGNLHHTYNAEVGWDLDQLPNEGLNASERRNLLNEAPNLWRLQRAH